MYKLVNSGIQKALNGKYVQVLKFVMVRNISNLFAQKFYKVVANITLDYNNNNNNNLIYMAPACGMTSEALADSSSRATECLTEK